MYFKKPKDLKRKRIKSLKTKLTFSDYKSILDTLFSLYIRELYDWKCMNPNCKRHVIPHDRGSKGLTASHYVVREHLKLRWDEKNVGPLCWAPCHMKWESQKNGAYRQYMFSMYGQKYVEDMELIGNISNPASLTDEEINGLSPDLKPLLFLKVNTATVIGLIEYYKMKYKKLCESKGVPMICHKKLKPIL